MNFLAHISLSGKNPKIMVGNFIGDFVKGRNLLEQFEPGIARGIELHRAIDEFTDSHPIVAKSKNRLRPGYRHYSAVIVDMFYDHLLAKNWDHYYDEFLPDFAERTYRTIESFDAILPTPVKFMLPYMTKGNWLVNYARLEGIERALSGMARRSRHESKMELAVNDLVKHYDEFTHEFSIFFPELQQHCKTLIAQQEEKEF
ncbi:MAG TPA: ACP phosphodiesterase [Cyclobacteriaceae bacterium]|nr:ACP phosphodiesterase [Cyclobacteriaceae bacterium]HRJ82952.1 ACP phosphodiesterase [Cyclobacteriaceae bacterium]